MLLYKTTAFSLFPLFPGFFPSPPVCSLPSFSPPPRLSAACLTKKWKKFILFLPAAAVPANSPLSNLVFSGNFFYNKRYFKAAVRGSVYINISFLLCLSSPDRFPCAFSPPGAGTEEQAGIGYPGEKRSL